MYSSIISSKLFYVLDPVVFDGVGQAPEDVVAILHAPRDDFVDFLVLGVVIHEIEHVHGPPRLAEALDPSEALFEPRRIPGQVDIDQRAQGLQVQALHRPRRSQRAGGYRVALRLP